MICLPLTGCIFCGSGDSTINKGIFETSCTTVWANNVSTALLDSFASAKSCSIDWPLAAWTTRSKIRGKSFCKEKRRSQLSGQDHEAISDAQILRG